MTTSGYMTITRRKEPFEVLIRCEWSWESGVPGSIALGPRGLYLDTVRGWDETGEVALTDQEKEQARELFPCEP